MGDRHEKRSRARAATLAASLATAAAFAMPAVAAAEPRDSAVGGGTVGDESGPLGAQHVGFAAFGGPTTLVPAVGGVLFPGGDPVTGHFRAGGDFGSDATAFQQEGPVTCLVVDDNRARLVYPNKQARPEANEALDILIFLEDNGRPGDGGPRDRIGFALVTDETPTEDPPSEQDDECVAPVQTPVMSELTRGDFRISDVR